MWTFHVITYWGNLVLLRTFKKLRLLPTFSEQFQVKPTKKSFWDRYRRFASEEVMSKRGFLSSKAVKNYFNELPPALVFGIFNF